MNILRYVTDCTLNEPKIIIIRNKRHNFGEHYFYCIVDIG